MATNSKWCVASIFISSFLRFDLRVVLLSPARRRIAAIRRHWKPTCARVARLSRFRVESQPSVCASESASRRAWQNGRRAASIMSSPSPQTSASPPQNASKNAQNNVASDANIRNFAPVARIMKMALPENAKIAKEAKECMQECVSEFISFITSEG